MANYIPDATIDAANAVTFTSSTFKNNLETINVVMQIPMIFHATMQMDMVGSFVFSIDAPEIP